MIESRQTPLETYFLALVFATFITIQSHAQASCIEAEGLAQSRPIEEASIEATIYLKVIDHLIHANHAGHSIEHPGRVFIGVDTFRGEYYTLRLNELLESESKIDLIGPPLPRATQRAITQRLSDRKFQICWLNSRTRLRFKEDGSIAGGGVIVTLGVQRHDKDGSIAVEAEIYAADLASALWTFTFVKEKGEWILHSAKLIKVS